MVTERLAYTVEEFAQTIGISRSSAYRVLKQYNIETVRLGGRTLVPRAAVERLLNRQQETAHAA